MGVERGATYCRRLDDVKDNGFNFKIGTIPIKRTKANSDKDRRPRWSVDLPQVHGIFTILQANRDARGNLQNNLKIHYYARNWNGYLIIKASYVAKKDGPHIDHYFAYDLEDSAGCILSTQSEYGLYNINWSYQLTGHPMGKSNDD